MASIGSINGLIRILYDGRGVAQAGQDVSTTSEKFDKAGNVAGTAGAAIAAGLGFAVNAAANFEKSLSAVSAVSGASTGEMEKMRAKALQLGEDTSFGATEAADAMGELAKAGLTTSEILDGAADATVALAAAGEIDLPFAATIAANAMNQFTDVAAKDMPKVADLIAGAANASAISVHDFGMSLSQVGAVANTIGFSFEDTAGAIALLGNAGIKGSDAGTSLKTMFLNLQPTTEKQIGLFEKLGLSQFNTAKASKVLQANGIKPLGNSTGVLTKQLSDLATKQSGAKAGSAAQIKAYQALTLQTGVMSNEFFDANGKVKSMSAVFGTLQTALKDQTKEQKLATLQTIFGSDAIRASAIAAELGKGGFDELAASMRKISAEKVAEERLNNLKGDMEKLKGSAETAAIGIGTVLIPMLRDLAKFIEGLVNKFNELDPSTQQNIVAFLAWSAGALVAFAAIVKLVGIIRTVIGAVKTLWSGIQFLTAVVRLNGGMALMMARSWATAAIAWIRATSAAVANRVATIANTAATRVAAIATTVWAAITNVMTLTNIRAAAATVLSTIASLAQRAALVAGAIATVVMTGAQAALNLVLALNPIGLIIIAIIALVAVFVLAYKKSDTFRAIVDTAFKAIKTTIVTAINIIKAVISAVWNFISKVFTTQLGVIRTVVTFVFQLISTIIRTAINVVKNIISTVVAFVVNKFNQFKALVKLVSDAFSSIVSAIKGRIAAIIATVAGLIVGIVNKVKGIKDSLVNAGRDLIQGLIDGISNMAGAVMDKAKDLANSVKDTVKDALSIGSPSRVMMELGVETAQGFADGIKSLEARVSLASLNMAAIPMGAATGGVSLAGRGGGYVGTSGNTTSVSQGPGVVLETGAVQVTVPNGMSPDQVGEHTARRISTTLTTRTSGPRINVGSTP